MGIVLAKIVDEKYIQTLLDGYLYMRTLDYFIDLEKKFGEKGRGDRLEKSFCSNAYEMPSGCPINLELQADFKAYIFCAMSFNTEQKQKISSCEKEKIKDFGNKVVLWNELNKFSEVAQRSAFNTKQGLISYYDESNEISIGQMQAWSQGVENVGFYKDSYFSYQREYRVMLPVNEYDKDEKLLRVDIKKDDIEVLDIHAFLERYFEII